MHVPDSLRIIVRNLVINSIIEAKWFPRPLRPWALRLSGIPCGKSMIHADVFFDGRRARIGTGAMLNNQIYIDARDDVTIGDRTFLAARVSIMTSTHVMGGHEQRAGELLTYPVTIGDGVWIGADVTILPGVRIGDGAVIGAGALVTKDCEPDGLYVGRPAQLVRRLDLESGENISPSTDH